MIPRILVTALLASGLCAQDPIYDNGPFETSPGFSNLDTTLGHGIFGYGAQFAFDNQLYENFMTPPSGMTVEQVEFYCYQTGAGSGPSTITAAYITFYDTHPGMGAPPMAGSPALTTNLFPPVCNKFSGVYRELDENQATNRAIMRVRVSIGTPLVLAPSTTYWIGIQAAGDPSIGGPWFPPITCHNRAVTGDALQRTGINWNDPIVDGGDPQGIPFQLFGTGTPVFGIQQLTSGCGDTGITVTGCPTLGGFIQTELTLSNQVNGFPIIGYDLGYQPNPTTFCGCAVVYDSPITLWFATSHVIELPSGPAMWGLPVLIQGIEVYGFGGCTSPAVNFTDGYRFVIQ